MNEPSIEMLHEKKIIGYKRTASMAQNITKELWQSFMPRKKEIQNLCSENLFSIQLFSSDFFRTLSPEKTFEKWAGVEVCSLDYIPKGMETLIIPNGLYAIFHHFGPASKSMESFDYIFRSWLPGSAYILDNRPHFEIMDERYKHEEPDSEEMFYIPVKPV